MLSGAPSNNKLAGSSNNPPTNQSFPASWCVDFQLASLFNVQGILNPAK